MHASTSFFQTRPSPAKEDDGTWLSTPVHDVFPSFQESTSYTQNIPSASDSFLSQLELRSLEDQSHVMHSAGMDMWHSPGAGQEHRRHLGTERLSVFP